MRFGRQLVRKPWFQRTLGEAMALYLRLVRLTNPLRREPADLREAIAPHHPAIIAMWHGQHFMLPFARPRDYPVAVMISRHHEAEVNAIAAERLGLTTVRASGAHRHGQRRKGGMVGFREMMRHLEAGTTVALTADVPKVSRIVGEGIVLLAKHSGRPIVPLALATSRNLDMNSWDKASLSLPFGRGGVVLGEPIHVPADLEDDRIVEYREKVREGLDRVNERAYRLAGGRWKFASEGRDA